MLSQFTILCCALWKSDLSNVFQRLLCNLFAKGEQCYFRCIMVLSFEEKSSMAHAQLKSCDMGFASYSVTVQTVPWQSWLRCWLPALEFYVCKVPVTCTGDRMTDAHLHIGKTVALVYTSADRSPHRAHTCLIHNKCYFSRFRDKWWNLCLVLSKVSVK